ncbi:MAG: hypothetical protein QXH07_02440 [Thermoplasmata archaeon]
MSEYYYAAVPKLKIVVPIGGRENIELNEWSIDEIRREFETILNDLDHIVNYEEVPTEKKYTSMTVSDIGHLVKVYEDCQKLIFDIPRGFYRIVSFVLAGLEVVVYSDYDEEERKKYEGWLVIPDTL